MIENEQNEITLIFHSGKGEDNKMRAFVETIATYKVKSIDLKRDSLTETQLAEIVDKMKVAIYALLDSSYFDSIEKSIGSKLNVKKMSQADILILIKQNPLLLITPILIIGNRAYAFESAFQILKEIFNIDGVGSIQSSNIEERK